MKKELHDTDDEYTPGMEIDRHNKVPFTYNVRYGFGEEGTTNYGRLLEILLL